MRHSFAFFGKISLLALVFVIIFTSCEKENVDVIEEEVIEEVAPIMAITIAGTTTEFDAVAAYCSSEDGRVFLQVSNNADLLGTPVQVEDFQIDDFLIFYVTDGSSEFTLGGAAFEDTISGTTTIGTAVILDDSAANVVIDEASTEEIVIGSMAGLFTLQNGEEAEYSVEFTAEVIQESPWCQ